MSEQYKKYLEQKALLKNKHAAISKELEQCELEIEQLRASYSVSCDHPVKFSRFPVCAVCYKVPEKSVEHVLPVAPAHVLPVEPAAPVEDPASELFETDVSFDRAIVLVQRISVDLYKNEWQCTYGRDSIGIFELQFTRRNERDAIVFARPHDLPAVLSRDGGRFWYDKDCGRRPDWKRMQYGMDGPIVEQTAPVE